MYFLSNVAMYLKMVWIWTVMQFELESEIVLVSFVAFITQKICMENFIIGNN